MVRAWDVANRVFWDIHSATWDSWSAGAGGAGRAASVAGWLQALGVPRGAPVLDAGCATGETSIALARAGFRVTGLDLSPAMLRRARRKAAAAGCEAAFRVGSLNDTLPFADGSFEAVVCAHTIQCVRDLPPLWREVRRVLVPRGTLAVEAKLPGGVVAGPDAPRPAAWLTWRLKRWADRAVVHVLPGDLAAQLEACRFTEVRCAVGAGTSRVSARGPTRG